jgi:hypothetical protein
MLKKLKDAGLSKAAKIAVNQKIKEFGKMLKFELNSKEKTIYLEVLLDGEDKPLQVDIGSYELIQKDDKHLIVIHEVKTSREWINVVAAKYLEGKSFTIPSEYAKLLKVVV